MQDRSQTQITLCRVEQPAAECVPLEACGCVSGEACVLLCCHFFTSNLCAHVHKVSQHLGRLPHSSDGKQQSVLIQGRHLKVRCKIFTNKVYLQAKNTANYSSPKKSILYFLVFFDLPLPVYIKN